MSVVSITWADQVRRAREEAVREHDRFAIGPAPAGWEVLSIQSLRRENAVLPLQIRTPEGVVYNLTPAPLHRLYWAVAGDPIAQVPAVRPVHSGDYDGR